MMDDKSIRPLQIKLNELMKVLHEICVKNNINYYMVGGTMLGAIRHKGFIPWDDDIDIAMPRADYEKFLALPKDEWPDYIYIKTPKNSQDLIFPYSKFINKNTTLVEDRLDGIVQGIYIDIFPLDGAGNFKFYSKLHFYKFFWKQGLLYYNQDHGVQRNWPRRLVQWYARKKNVKILFENAENCLKSIKYERSEYVGNFVGAWGLKEITPKEYMGVPTFYQFEDSFYYGVENVDAYLKSLYGDYMKLPPIEKQKSHHVFKHLDLEMPFSNYEK